MRRSADLGDQVSKLFALRTHRGGRTEGRIGGAHGMTVSPSGDLGGTTHPVDGYLMASLPSVANGPIQRWELQARS